jgi:curved DNA-binding protein CbpA
VADYYEVLQVHPSADAEVIRAAYRILARKYHPDHGGDPRRMIALNDAWDVLGDPVRRAAYDAARASTASTVAARPGPGDASPPAARPATPSGTAAPTPGVAYADSHAGPPPGRPSGTVIQFGRYAGWSLGEIARHDIDYLEWLQRTTFGRRLRDEIEALLKQRGSRGTAGSQGLPRR